MNDVQLTPGATTDLAQLTISQANSNGLVTRGQFVSDSELLEFHFANRDRSGRLMPHRNQTRPDERTSFEETSAVQMAAHNYNISFLYRRPQNRHVFETVFAIKSIAPNYKIVIRQYRMRSSLGSTIGPVPGLDLN